MKSTINKMPLGQIEKGDELEKIEEKAIDDQVVHKTGEQNEEIDGKKTFKEAPKSQKKAAEDQHLVRYKEFELDMVDLRPLVDDAVRITNINQLIDGVKSFKNAPKSQKDAATGQELVRYSQYTADLENKVDDDDVMHLSDVDETAMGVKTFDKSPKSETAASVDEELMRKKEHDSDLSEKVDKEQGKGLSSNDYTDDEKTKLEGIETGAEKNKVNSVNTKDGDVILGADDIDESVDRKWAGETGADVTANHTSADSQKLGGELPEHYAKDDEVVKTTEKGAPGGVAELDIEGKVPTSQLPSYVSDIREFPTENDFPATGETGVIYVAKDTNKTYRWSGTGYVVIGDGELQLGDTSETAHRGDHGKTAYEHSQKTSGNPHNVTKTDVGLGNVTNDKQLKSASNLEDLPSKSTARINLGLGSAARKDESFFAKPTDIKNATITIKQTGETDQSFDLNQENPKTINLENTTYELASEVEKGLLSKEDKAKLNSLEQGGQKNVQADYAELDAELDSFIENKESYIDVSDELTFFEGDSQMLKLSNDLHKLISVEVMGQGLIRSQFNEWHNAIEILDPLDDVDIIKIAYKTPTDYSRIHGIRFDVSVAAPEIERVGNADMASELPIQKGMKGCVLKDNGQVNYWLHPDDWTQKEDETPSDLTGADGQVVVRIPRHWIKDTQKGDIRTVLFSDKPFEGATEVPELFLGAYKAALDRNDNILSSVVNDSVQFRGGNNQSAWDSESDYKSQRGKPATAISRINFRDYANNRGQDWHIIDMVAHQAVAWLATYEFGTRDHQSAISDGPTELDSTKWSEYNSRYPIFRCGLTNSLGNGTGEISLDISGEDLGADSVSVFRYRGIENWWGDIYEWMSGVNVIDNKYYMTTGKLESDTDAEGYKLIGDRPTSNGYIQEMYPGTLLPKTNNGSSSTYYADYLYTNDTTSIRGLLRSASAHYSAPAGSFFVHSHGAPSRTSADFGSRLCFSKR